MAQSEQVVTAASAAHKAETDIARQIQALELSERLIESAFARLTPQRMPPESDYVYMLELSLNYIKPDGAYHRLKVKADGNGAQIQARHGYYAPLPLKPKK